MIWEPNLISPDFMASGGLLAATVAVKRPDLLGAVVDDVPPHRYVAISDTPMMGMGGAWIDEYEDPSSSAMRVALRRYSPFNNIKPGDNVPVVLHDRFHRGQQGGAGPCAQTGRALGAVAKAYYVEDSEGVHGVR